MTFSPGGQRILSGSMGRLVEKPDPENKDRIVRFYSRDDGRTLRIWDTASGKQLLLLKSGAGPTRSIDFKGSGAVTAHSYGVIGRAIQWTFPDFDAP